MKIRVARHEYLATLTILRIFLAVEFFICASSCTYPSPPTGSYIIYCTETGNCLGGWGQIKRRGRTRTRSITRPVLLNIFIWQANRQRTCPKCHHIEPTHKTGYVTHGEIYLFELNPCIIPALVKIRTRSEFPLDGNYLKFEMSFRVLCWKYFEARRRMSCKISLDCYNIFKHLCKNFKWFGRYLSW